MGYKARVPPSATPAMVMMVVRNGNCSIGAMALDDLAVDEEVAEAEAAVPEAAADDEALGVGSATNERRGRRKGVKGRYH
jgi:hypothetical protein